MLITLSVFETVDLNVKLPIPDSFCRVVSLTS